MSHKTKTLASNEEMGRTIRGLHERTQLERRAQYS
jgi:hypothetical protein